MTPTPMETLLTSIGTLFTQVVAWLGEVFTMIVSTPILLIFIGLTLVGVVVSFAKRLIK